MCIIPVQRSESVQCRHSALSWAVEAQPEAFWYVQCTNGPNCCNRRIHVMCVLGIFWGKASAAASRLSTWLFLTSEAGCGAAAGL